MTSITYILLCIPFDIAHQLVNFIQLFVYVAQQKIKIKISLHTNALAFSILLHITLNETYTKFDIIFTVENMHRYMKS